MPTTTKRYHLPEPTRALDDDALLLAGLLVLSTHMQDTVRVDVERHLDLWYAPATGDRG